MEILTIKNTLLTPVHRLEEEIPFKFRFLSQLRKIESQRREMPYPSLDGKHMAELALSPSLVIPRSVLGSSW